MAPEETFVVGAIPREASASRVLSRARAIEQSLKFFFTGKPCTRGHIAERYTSGGAGCRTCTQENGTRLRAAASLSHKDYANLSQAESFDRDLAGAAAKPSSKKEAIEKGAAKYFTGVPCSKGHLAERRTSDSYCQDCKNASSKAASRAKRASEVLIAKHWATQNPELHEQKEEAARDAEIAAELQKKAGHKRRNAEWQERHPARCADIRRKSSADPRAVARRQQWAKNNKDCLAYHANLRRARKLHATPKWADLKEIKKVYKAAREVSISSGVAHSVDHTLPLKGRLVSGLHVHNNLRVITATENSKKNNRYDPMSEIQI